MSKYYLNLINQLNRLYRHNRAGSYRTRTRYYEAMQRFCRFLAERYHLERLANIAPKHLVAYVAFLQESGKSPATIKTDLAAIRFFHDLMQTPRHQLPGNGELLLQRRTFGGVDRSWSREEFSRALAEALRLGREDYVTILYLARYAGLRIHECFRIDTATAERAIREGGYHHQGQGRPCPDSPAASHPGEPPGAASAGYTQGTQALCPGWRPNSYSDPAAAGVYSYNQTLHPGRWLDASHDLPRPPAHLCGGVVPGADRRRRHALRGPQGGLPAPGTRAGRCDENLPGLPPGTSYSGALAWQHRPF